MNFAQFSGFPASLSFPQFSVGKVHMNQDVLSNNELQITVSSEGLLANKFIKAEARDNVSDYFVRFSGQPTFPSNLQTLYSYKPCPDVAGKNQVDATANASQGEQKSSPQIRKLKKKKKRANSFDEPFEPRKRSTSLQPTVSSTVDGHTVFSCPQCHAVFNDQETVNNHMAIHRIERPFVCEDCGAALKRKEHLDRHKSSHTTERPHLCHVCNKSFKRQEHLQRHSITHRADKAHHCVECGKGFNRKDHLNKHIQSHFSKRFKQDIPNSPSVRMNPGNNVQIHSVLP